MARKCLIERQSIGNTRCGCIIAVKGAAVRGATCAGSSCAASASANWHWRARYPAFANPVGEVAQRGGLHPAGGTHVEDY